MKKIFMFALILAPLAFATVATAQTQLKSSTYSNFSDTVTNATTHYLQVGPILGAHQYAFVQLNDSSISGTLAGTVKIQYSNDGVGWGGFNKDSAYTASSSALTQCWSTDLSARFVRVVFVGSGTQSTKIWGSISLKPAQ